jgi:hypothetical protein
MVPNLAAYLGFDGTSLELENENAIYTLSISGTTVTFESEAKEDAINTPPEGETPTETNPDLEVDLSDGTITPYPTGKPA